MVVVVVVGGGGWGSVTKKRGMKKKRKRWRDCPIGTCNREREKEGNEEERECETKRNKIERERGKPDSASSPTEHLDRSCTEPLGPAVLSFQIQSTAEDWPGLSCAAWPRCFVTPALMLRKIRRKENGVRARPPRHTLNRSRAHRPTVLQRAHLQV